MKINARGALDRGEIPSVCSWINFSNTAAETNSYAVFYANE